MMRVLPALVSTSLCLTFSLAQITPVYAAAERFSIFGNWGKSEEEPNKEDDAQAGTPNTLNDASPSEEAEVESGEAPPPIEISPQGPAIQRVPWQKTEFGNQAGSLGYKGEPFAVPNGFRERVNFWISIYSKYTTNQGVLHDISYPSVVYESLDFSELARDNRLNGVRRRHSREKIIKDHKAAIAERLLRLQNVKSADGLQGEDLRYWKMFEREKSPTKFADAAKKGRIRFQLGQKDRFALGIYYSGRYLNEMEKIFREENLPIELTRLPFVESSFNIYARSRVGASGIWQFMRRTARPYMMVNTAVDERNDPLRATRSAAKLLRANFELLGSWPLALTGWNHGPNGLMKIIKKTGTRDLPTIIEIYSSRRFGFASENFYACFLAALEVERHAHKYFGDVKWSVPLEHAEVHLSRPIPYEAVHVWFSGDDELAQLYNPHFSSGVRGGRQSMPRGTNVRIPKVMESFALAFIDGKTNLAKIREAIAQANIKVSYPTLNAVIASANITPPSTAPAVTPPPAPLATPVAKATPASATPSVAAPTATPVSTPVPGSTPALAEQLAGVKEEVRATEYKVARGDKLLKIAKKFGLTKAGLKVANPELKGHDRIKLGQVLVIPPAPLATPPTVNEGEKASSPNANLPKPTLLPEATPALVPVPTLTPPPMTPTSDANSF